MSEESDVDLDMDGVVEVSHNVFYLMHKIRQRLGSFYEYKIYYLSMTERQQTG